MSSGSVNSVGSQTGTASSTTDAFQKLDTSTFLKLLVTELSNQDPLEPMSSSEIVNQVSQIRSIQASTQLTTTLEAVLLGQNVATASSLLGRTITGLTDDSKSVTGQVDRVSVIGGAARLQIGDNTVDLKNVSEILPAEAT
jgi:flagellar basal-body rod modification protein FlgD